MGAYLSQPITDKVIEAGANSTLEYAVAAMQGWRTEMEDAHVCALELEKETSIFGVFDGHGGKEVARFVALHLVDELLATQGFKEADIPLSLKEAYLSLDALIRSEKSRSELLKLSAVQKTEEEKTLERVIQVDHLPKLLREAISASRLQRDPHSGSHDGSDSDITEFDTEDADSSYDEERARAQNVGSFPITLSEDSSSSSGSEMEEIVEELPQETCCPDEGCSNAVADSEPFVPLEPSTPMEPAVEVATSQPAPPPVRPNVMFNTSDSTGSTECRSTEEAGVQGAEITTPVASETPTAKVELGSNPEKIEMLEAATVVEDVRVQRSRKASRKSHERSASVMGGLLSFVCPFGCLRTTAIAPEEPSVLTPSSSSVMTSGPSTPSPVAPEKRESAAEDWLAQPPTPTHDEAETEETLLEPREEITEAPVVETEDADDATNGRDVTVAGCTAVVAVIRGEKLFVANAGDSRCVLCHDGIALPMSRDHKPTDPEEYVRIKNAGGFVSDGRVNGCLNLSRALGDMEYKKSPHLAPEEYMITANPDVKKMDLQSGDHFLILACDGIWDVLSDQEACDFVLSRLQQNQSLKSISAQLCDFCLAEDAEGSGEGCDNMTAMIVMLKQFASDPASHHH